MRFDTVLLPEEQRRIKDRCRHPSGNFVEFSMEETEQSIPERFEKQVRLHPDRTAVRTGKHSLSYRELDGAANRIARAVLAEQGEGREPVALLLGHDAPLIAAIMGVLKAGKMYVPLDPSFPRARLEYIIEDSTAELILTDDENLEYSRELTGDGRRVMNVDHLDSGLSTDPVSLSIPPESPIYILYTSGSTGRPKGVVQDHRHRLHDILIHTNGLNICAEDRLNLLYSCSTGMGTTVLFSALLNGAAILPYDLKEEGLGPLARHLAREKVTIYHSIATVLRHFMNTLNGNEGFPHLRLAYQSGEPLYRKDAELFMERFPESCILVNGLGAGETARLRRFYIDRTTPIPGSVVPVGYPVEDKDVLLLDDEGREVEPGGIGEIAIRSRYLSPGYWNRPDLTERAFLSDPEWGEERIYLTGDLGQLSPDGCLTHMGRKDFQVKIRGNRVEIPEIEAVLHELTNVKEAVVVMKDDGRGERSLTAYLAAEGVEDPDIGAIRRSLAESLPDFMIPSRFVLLEDLPHLPNGKIDRMSLPDPDPGLTRSGEGLVAPRDDIEKSLAGIWEKVLGTSPIGVSDDFFDLGGNSLRAMSMALEVEKTLGRKLPLALLCRAPTIEGLAAELAGENLPQKGSSLVPLQTGGFRTPLFCVHGAGGYVLFYMDLARRLGPDQPVYGLQSAGLDGDGTPLTSVEEMAARYIGEMCSIQPEGPYLLGGFCLGAYIALEMARQLLDQGEETDLLAAFNPSGGEREATSFFGGVRLHRRRFSRMERGEKTAYLADRVRYRLERLQGALAGVFYRLSRGLSRSLSYRLHPYYLREVNHRAGMRHVPGQYRGSLKLFLGDGDAYKNPESYWGGLAAGGVETRIVPGKHIGIFKEPDVEVLARELKGYLMKGLLTVILILLPLLCPVQSSAEYPEKTVNLLVGFEAGGATDLLGRLVGEGLEKELGTAVVVINKPGAGGALAYDEVHRAKSDGYTLGWVTGSLFTTTGIGHLKWGYDGLDPVARIARWPMVVGVRTDASWKTWEDFLADAGKNPGRYKFGHAGTGSIGHLMNVAVSSGAEVIQVPIGADGRFPALLGGQIDLLSAPAAGFVNFSQAGKMRALIVSSEERVPLLPETPTTGELGIDYDVDLMYGVFVPPGTPEKVKKRLRTALGRVADGYQPLHDFIRTKKMNLDHLDGPELDRWLKEQNDTVVRIMKEVGLYKPSAGKQ